MVEKCKTTDGRNADLETSIHCLFNFKDQRVSDETGLGRGFLGSKLSRINIYPYDINLHTGIFCRTLSVQSLYSFNLHKFMGEKTLESYTRVQSHHFWHSRSPMFIRECWRGVSYITSSVVLSHAYNLL